ncbi:MAG TPA: MauE/DoxX family redox-associated membrane protein [Acidimicrobiales bacterium]
MLTYGPMCIVAIVLAVAGGWKIARPAVAHAALVRLRAPIGTAGVRVLGGGELALGVAAAIVGGRALPTAVALLYVAFAVVAWRLGRIGVGCGCFGTASSTPPGRMHVVVDIVAAAIAGSAAASDAPSLRDALDAAPAAGVPHALLIATGTLALLGLLTVLPEARSIATSAPQAPQPVLFRPTRRSR